VTRLIGENGAGRILVVDDDATIRLLARTTLVYAGYQVAEAANGDAALNMFAMFNSEVVLLEF
jgi:CheY-like chemotaxis protein